jgi:hypothetical protein
MSTTYSHWGQGQTGTIPADYSLSRVANVKLEAVDKINMEDTGIRGSYHTETRDCFTPQHSVLAQDAAEREELQKNLKRTRNLNMAATAKSVGQRVQANK